MPQQIETFLTLPAGVSKKAAEFYVKLFPNSSVLSENVVAEGTERETYLTNVKIADTTFTFMDMKDAPALNWSTSLMFNVDSKEEFHRLFDQLKIDGKVMMGPEAIEMAGIHLCCWVVDKFNITWQIVWK